MSSIMTFFKGVRAELKRTTWPTRQNVLQWTIIVICALIFFGLFTFGFDNLWTALLVLITSI